MSKNIRFNRLNKQEKRRSGECKPAEEHPVEKQWCRRLQNHSTQRHPQLKICSLILKLGAQTTLI